VKRRRKYRLGLGADSLDAEARGGDRHDRLIPMINIVFLLLTFFLIAGTMRLGEALRIEPPRVATGGNIARRSPVLSVEANGALHFQGETMGREQAIAAIKEAITDRSGEQLHIKADRQTPASIILPLVQELEKEGVHRVRLIAVKKGE